MEAARKDSAVHVSLSSDSLFKQPEDEEPSISSNLRPYPFARADPPKPKPSDCSEAFPLYQVRASNDAPTVKAAARQGGWLYDSALNFVNTRVGSFLFDLRRRTGHLDSGRYGGRLAVLQEVRAHPERVTRSLWIVARSSRHGSLDRLQRKSAFGLPLTCGQVEIGGARANAVLRPYSSVVFRRGLRRR
jgi:hypothetical protein